MKVKTSYNCVIETRLIFVFLLLPKEWLELKK